MVMEYDVDYFIKKFEKIPEDNWIACQMHNGDKHCALGHCLANMNEELKGEAKALHYLMFESIQLTVFQVNDYISQQYPQKHPKQRVMAALYDIRDKQLSEANIKAANELINQPQELV